MKKKSLFFQNLLKILILVACSLCIVGFRLPDNTSERINKPVYIVTDESDYFRLITVSTNPKNNIPILLLSGQKSTTKLDNFQKYYQGTSAYLSSHQIDDLIIDHYPNPSQVVVCDKTKESMLFGSLISSALQIPLFVETVPSEVLGDQKLSSIITVGEVKLTTGIKTEKLDSFEKAQNYYNLLVDKTDTAVVMSDPEVYSIGAESAAYHRAKVFFTIEDGKNSKTDNLIWVTLPENLGQPNFLKLYASDSVTNVNGLYSQNIGVITGFTIEDMSFLLARTFAYHDMQGDWKLKIVYASMDTDETSIISTSNGVQEQYLGRTDFYSNTLEKAISSANYVITSSHGGPTGIVINDGVWPQNNGGLSIPPLLFVADACSTMDLDSNNLNQSIALKLISSGAMAYVGSMELGGVSVIGRQPFYHSTSQTPLGELVRMANSVRMNFDADNAKVILIGDPTFYYVKDQLDVATPTASTHASGYAFEIKNASEKSDIILNIQSQKPIVRAVATLDDGRKITFFPGANYFGAPMGIISNGSGYTIQIPWRGDNGIIVFYDTWSLPVYIMRVLANSFSGAWVLLQNLTTIGNPWNFPIVLFLLALIFNKRLLLKKDRVIPSLLVSLLFSILIVFFLFYTSWSIRIPISIAMFIWCFISLSFFEKIQSPIKKTIFSIFLFLIPFLYGLLVVLLASASSKTTIVVLQGIILLGFVFFILRVILYKFILLKLIKE